MTNTILIDIVIIAIISAVAYIFIKIINYFIKKSGEKFELEVTVTQILQEIVKYSIITVALIIIFDELGVNVTAFIVSLGVLGIVVGYAARDTLSNFISGLFVLGTKSFKVGDFIEVSGQRGTVSKMGFRNIILTTIDNKVITVPNSLFSTDPFINYTALDKRRVELEITVPYEMDLKNVIESMKEKALILKWALSEPAPNITVNELSDSGIKVTLNVWTTDPWNILTHQSELAIEIKGIITSKAS